MLVSEAMTTPVTVSRRTGCALFLFLAAAFLILNRQAYQGYFQDDEINSMAWTRWGPAIAFLKGAVTPVFAGSFRAVGFYYFRLTEGLFGLDFPKYVGVIHAIHLVNAWMLWLLIRRLGAPPAATAVGVIFFALHAALFDVFWKPMFVFDLLCGTFSLASTWLWARGNWVLSFIAFWLAYRSKELAVMLPLVLVCYELWFGSHRWKMLAPFLVASFSFTLQALVLNPVTAPPYKFHLSRHTLGQTAPFYAGKVFLLPYLGFLLPVGAAIARNRRTWFGLAMLGLYLVPLLCLPGRIFSAYCYLPFTGLAVAMAGLAERVKPLAILVFLLAWLPLDIHSLDVQRDATLRQDGDIRVWMTTVEKFLKNGPAVTEFVYDGLPAGFYPFGAEATLRYFLVRLDVPLFAVNSPEAAELGQRGHWALLKWDAAGHRLTVETR
jgi:hypothetical protein